MSETENERLTAEFFDTLSSGDLEALRRLFHPDASWAVQVQGIPGAGTHRGRDAIIDFLAPVRALFKPGDPKVKISSMASKGDLVLVESTSTGTLNDGRTYDNRYAWAVELKDGKVFTIREYMDSFYVAKLFGLG